MLIVSNTAEQTVAPGQTVIFTIPTFNTKRCPHFEFFRIGTGGITVVPGTYKVSFGANVSGATAGTPVQLSIALDGSPLVDTTMISTPSVANDFNSVYRSTTVNVPCQTGSASFTVTNTGTTDIIIGANPQFEVIRRC